MQISISFLLFHLYFMLCSVAAEPISGTDDPAVRAAALDWLNGETADDALATLGSFAADGNVAARLLMNRIDERFLVMDFPGLGTAERRAFLPPDRHAMASDEQLYFVDETTIPAFVALEAMSTATTSQDWIAHAEVVLSAGLSDAFARQAGGIFARAGFDNAAMRFVYDNAASGSPLQTTIWHSLILYHMYLPYLTEYEPEKAAEFGALFSGVLERDEFVSELSQALREERWGALDVLGTAFVIDPPFGREISPSASHTRWAMAMIMGGSREHRQSKPSDLSVQEIGDIVIRDSERSPHLLPFVQACKLHCADEVTTCVSSVMLLTGPRAHQTDPVFSPPGLEPLISDAEFYMSGRALPDALALIRQIEETDWLPLPQCIGGAAAGDAMSPE